MINNKLAVSSAVRFVPRVVAEQITPFDGELLISIRDPSQPPPDLKAGWADVLYLVFDDADVEEEGKVIFNNSHAAAIQQFVAKNCDFGPTAITVHCQAGISRSAAVAMGLNEFLRIPLFNKTQPCPTNYALYNRKVYRVLSGHLQGYVE